MPTDKHTSCKSQNGKVKCTPTHHGHGPHIKISLNANVIILQQCPWLLVWVPSELITTENCTLYDSDDGNNDDGNMLMAVTVVVVMIVITIQVMMVMITILLVIMRQMAVIAIATEEIFSNSTMTYSLNV